MHSRSGVEHGGHILTVTSDPPPIRWQIAAEWLDTAQWSQRSANRKTAIALSSGTIDDRLRPSLPSKLGSQMHPS